MGDWLRWTDRLKVRNHIATGVKGFFNGCNDIGPCPGLRRFFGLLVRLG